MFKGWIAAAFTLIVWGVTFVNTRILLTEFSALEIQLLRFALAWGTLALIGWTQRKRYGWQGRREALFAAMGLTGVFVYQFLENCAIYYTNASNVAILVSFGPIVTALMARLALDDRSLSLRLVAGSLVAIAGVALVAVNGVVTFHLRPLGDLMALGAMISWGAYSILIGKANALGVPPLVAARKSFGWALAIMLPLAIWGATESGYVALDGSYSVTLDPAANAARFRSPENVFNLLFLGILASAVCFVLWNVACKALGVVRTTVCLYLIPVIGVLFAYFCLHEPIAWMSAAGGVLILVGVVTATMKRGVRK
ncbi:MAG: DMT family transporter [Kiritimatiellia bacterium]